MLPKPLRDENSFIDPMVAKLAHKDYLNAF